MSAEFARETRSGAWVMVGAAWALSLSREGLWPGLPAIVIAALVAWRPSGVLPRAALPLCVALSLVLAILQSFLLGDDAMLALTGFLMALQWSFYLVDRNERESAHVLWLNLVHMGVVASYGADLWFAPLALLVSISFLTSLSQRRLRRAAEGRVVAVAASGPKALLLRPLALVIFGSFALLFALLSFLFLPRSQWPLWAGFKRSPLMVGFSERVDLTRSGRLRLDHQVVMRVEPLDAVEVHPDDTYLRGWVYDLYQDQRWLRAFPAWSGDVERHEGGFLGPPAAMQITRVQRHRINIEGMRAGVVFTPGVTRGVRWLTEPSPRSLRYGLHNAVMSEFPYGPGTSYELACWMGVDQPPLPGPVSRIQTHRALSLPGNLPALTLLDLASQLCGPEWAALENPRLKAQRLVDALGKSYQYGLDISAAGPRDPVFHFLTISRRGHCELFASAFVLLMRAAGVPARLVNGFRLQEWSAELNCWLVRQSHAHAWAEIYVGEDGWVRVDPTPDINGHGPQQQSLMKWVDDFWSRHVLGFSSHDQASLWAKLKHSLQGMKSLRRLSTSERGPWLAVALALLLLGLLRFLLRRDGTRERGPRSVDRFRSTTSLRRLLHALAKKGWTRGRRESLSEFGSRVEDGTGLKLRGLIDRYERLRFGPTKVDSASQDEAIKNELDGLFGDAAARLETR